MERRHSTTSESSNDSRQSSADGLECRVAKTMSPKVPANPLQFVKVGPCDLYRSAQEQLKKVEEIKKSKKEHRDDAEEWQSNLDNWKCSRRKRQEHIIERVVEVKKFELEEHERNRRRSKTFSEMMQERNTRGRKSSLPVWNDDSDDLSDLGIASKNESYSEDNDDTHLENADYEGDASSQLIQCERNGATEQSHSESETSECKDVSKSSSESEEYTYERAIQSYVNFAETRVKSISSLSIDEDGKKEVKKPTGPPVPAKPKRGSLAKVDNYLSQLEQSKTKSHGDLTDPAKKSIAMPKVDIHKRREMFEKLKEAEDQSKTNRVSPDLPATKSIKERLSSLEKHQEGVEGTRTSVSIPSTGVKDRLCTIEKINSNSSYTSRRSSEPISSQTIKDRLSSFERSKVTPPKKNILEPTVSIKDRLNSLHSSCEKGSARTVIPNVDPAFNEKLSNFKVASQNEELQERAFSPDDDVFRKREQHYRHRSLDSLNQESMSNGSFERVQSLEDLDFRNYPPSTMSGDTDREDSGIHTADVSSSVSQADDYDLHLDGNILDDVKMNHQPPIQEETKLVKTDLMDELKSVSCEDITIKVPRPEVEASRTPDSSLSDALPPIPEVPSDPVDIFGNTSSYVNSSPQVASWSSHYGYSQPEESAIGEPDATEASASHLIDSYDNCPLNHNNANTTAYQGDLEVKTEEELTEGAGKAQVCLDSSSFEALPSKESQSVDASFCETKEEANMCNGITADVSHIEYENNRNMNISPKYANNNVPVTKNSQHLNTSDSEIKVYDIVETSNNNLLRNEKHLMEINVPIVNQLSEIILESEPSCLFPLSSVMLEPPKEKPPPPPTENSDDESDDKVTKKSLRRLDSTKRIKKEIRQKRSSFLGLEDNNDDSYLEPELELVRPPDMTTILTEERRLERQLYRQSVCSESDSNQESRDSGVELDPKHQDVWSHSRNDSETFGNQSTTSEEDEIMKKEREIIETLEQEEKIRKQDLGEKLAMRLRELEAEKGRIEWEHIQSDSPRNITHTTFPQHNHMSAEDLDKSRSRDVLLLDNGWCSPRASLQDVTQLEAGGTLEGEYRKSLGDLRMREVRYAQHRRSMPNLQEVGTRRPPPPPPPVLPDPQLIQPHPQQQAVQQQALQQQHLNGGGQMTRQTLQALSAAPRSRLIAGDSWQAKRKQTRPDAYNYQHWLIQEAEQRRITEQHQRTATNRRTEPVRRGVVPASTWQQQQQQRGKPLPDAIIQSLTQRVQSRLADPNNNRKRQEIINESPYLMSQNDCAKDRMLSVSGKKRCSHCGEELGRGAAMIIESLQLFYHIDCFKCCVCCIQLGDGLNGTDVRVRNNKLHCHNCYSSDDGAKFSCV